MNWLVNVLGSDSQFTLDYVELGPTGNNVWEEGEERKDNSLFIQGRGEGLKTKYEIPFAWEKSRGGCLWHLIPIVTRNKGSNSILILPPWSDWSTLALCSGWPETTQENINPRKNRSLSIPFISRTGPSSSLLYWSIAYFTTIIHHSLGRPSLCQVFVCKVEKLSEEFNTQKYTKGGSTKVFILFAAVLAHWLTLSEWVGGRRRRDWSPESSCK